MDILKRYIEEFNREDNEHHINYINNDSSLEWLENEIPIFECPDKDIERAYYFRWWTYRKHIKETQNGFAVSEFLLDVPWGDKYNIINAASGHHLAEGKWLKNSRKYLRDYIELLLTKEGGVDCHRYSSWLISALKEYYDVVGYDDLTESLFKKILWYYSVWEETHKLDNGMFWSIDDRDAMEYSISGTDENLNVRRGIRPTLNSYMCADCYAIAHLASRLNKPDVEKVFLNKADNLKRLINENLWKDGFYRALHYDNDYKTAFNSRKSPLEEIGYIPWMFNIPPKGREKIFDYLTDTEIFNAPTGITTADMRDDRFLYEVDHECLWNGYVWPFATSQTLTSMISVIRNYNATQYTDDFVQLLSQYAKSHCKIEDDRKIMWIDEVIHPFKQEWTSVTYLKEHDYPAPMGPKDRGKDYNHSTFCDLVISGICGVEVTDDDVKINPIIPDDWEYFNLSDLCIKDKVYSISYNKVTGLKVNKKQRR